MSISVEEFTALNESLMKFKAEVYDLREQLAKTNKREKALKEELSASQAKVSQVSTALVRADSARRSAESALLSSRDGSRVLSLQQQCEELKMQNEAMKENVQAVYKQMQMQALKQEREGEKEKEKEKEKEARAGAAGEGGESEEGSQARKEVGGEMENAAQQTIDSLRSENSRLSSELIEIKEYLAKTKPSPVPPTPSPPLFPVAQAVAPLSLSSAPAKVSMSDTNRNSNNNNNNNSSTTASTMTIEDALAKIDSQQEEIKQLQQVRDHFMTTIQKKDASVKSREDELDRLMSAVSSKDATIFSLREQVSVLDACQREVRAKTDRIKKLESALSEKESASERVHSLSLELSAAHASIVNLQNEYSRVLAQVEEMKDELFIHETQAQDRAQLLAANDEAVVKAREQAEKHAATVEQLKRELRNQEREFELHCVQIDESLKLEKEKWLSESAAAAATASASIRSLSESLTVTQDTLAAREAFIDRLEEKHATLTEAHETLEAEHKRVLEELDSVRSQLSAVEVDIRAAARKRNAVVFDLKLQLKKEAIKNKELTAQLSEARDDLENVRVKLKSKVLSNYDVNSFLSNSSPHLSPSHSASNLLGDDSSSSSSSSSSPTSSLSLLLSEVSSSLTTRLASLQDANFELQRQLKDALLHRQLLEEDVDQKRTMIRNLVRRLETGALTGVSENGSNSNEGGVTTESSLYRSLSAAEKDVLFVKMESLVQSTLISNARIKDEVLTLGLEITRLSDLHARTVNDLQAQLNDAQDERDLAMQAEEDAKNLLREVEARMLTTTTKGRSEEREKDKEKEKEEEGGGERESV